MYDESCLPRIGSNIRLLRGACQFNQQQFADVSASVRPI